MTTVIGRYAPSPTGPLHLGNLRTALLAWLHARSQGGKLILRMDDLDAPRNKPGSAEQILQDLKWLGFHWDDAVLYQSKRSDAYEAAFHKLKQTGRVFPCRCSRKDIGEALSAPDHDRRSASYPGTCRPENNPKPFMPDEPLAWRFRVDDREWGFNDEILGPQDANLANHPGDFIIRRKDGIFAYQLASVVDDGELGITDVIRVEDLLDSTARQIALFGALGYPIPRFWHVPLMNDSTGRKMGKRDGAESLAEMGAYHEPPGKVIARLAASLGWNNEEQSISAEELLERFDPKAGQLVD